MASGTGKGRRRFVYGLNYIARPLGKYFSNRAAEHALQTGGQAAQKGIEESLKSFSNLGHPYTALAFFAEDAIAENWSSFKNNYSHRFVKAGGGLYFGSLLGTNLVQIAHDYTNLDAWTQLPFNALMTWSFAKDMKNAYKDSDKNLFSDIKSAWSDITNS